MEQEDGVQEERELRVTDLAASWTEYHLVTQGTKREEQVFSSEPLGLGLSKRRGMRCHLIGSFIFTLECFYLMQVCHKEF